jgi:hypothetical protein
MNNDKEVNEILEKLRDLHLQQAELVNRIITITNREQGNESPRRETEHTVRTTTTTQEETTHRPFQIGDHVKVNNPKRSQFNRGTIKRIGAVQITVEAPSGKTLSRLPKNLTLLRPASPTFVF